MSEFLTFAAEHPWMTTMWGWCAAFAVWGFRPLVLASYVRRSRDCECECDESAKSDE